MSAKDHVSSQFAFLHEKEGKREHMLSMNDFDGTKAWVSFSHYNDPLMDPPSRIEVEYLKSHEEGKGHARRLMQHLYDRYPKSFIDWGRTIHPASTHLANEFEDKYYNRTAYTPDDEEEDW